MDSLTLIRRLHEHRQWCNAQLLDAAEQLELKRLRESFPIGQGSVWKSLTHLYAADYVWLAALQGDENPLTPGDLAGELPGNQNGPGGVQSLHDLRQRWHELDLRWVEYLASCRSEDLADLVRKTSSITHKMGETRRADILLHVCTHAQYTTAQIVNMLRHLGLEQLPDPMLITLARQERK